jgi:DNA-binding CsgD family transcriptional regulator
VFPSCETLNERFGLTTREFEVVRCLGRGLSYKAVADHLDISVDTVRSHVRSIYVKLQAQSVTEALNRVLRAAP